MRGISGMREELASCLHWSAEVRQDPNLLGEAWLRSPAAGVPGRKGLLLRGSLTLHPSPRPVTHSVFDKTRSKMGGRNVRLNKKVARTPHDASTDGE